MHAFVHAGRRRINLMEETAGRPDAVSVNVAPVTTGKDTRVVERFANLMPYTILIVLNLESRFSETDKSGQKRTSSSLPNYKRNLDAFWNASFS